MTRVTEADLAKRWDMTIRTLQNMRNTGRGPAYVQLSPKKGFYWLCDIESYEESVRVLQKPRSKATIKRAASTLELLASKAKPEAATTILKIRDDLRTLIDY